MKNELLYRVAIRNDNKGSIIYVRGTLSHLLRRLIRQRNGILDVDENDRIYLVPATHRMPWEIPPEEQTDANLKADD